jgi:hypothetical protein
MFVRRGRALRELIEGVPVLGVTVLDGISSDDLIAGVLNRNGHLTGRGKRWTRERVTALSSHHAFLAISPTSRNCG